MTPLIGIDIGGTKCAVSLGALQDGALEATDKRVVATADFSTPQACLEALIERARSLCPRPAAVGVSCGGPLDSRAGLILSPPNLPGWDRVPVVQILSQALGAPCYLQNDANACALAEWRFGAGRGLEHMIFLTFGTGMGAGLILNGQLYCGADDMAGEVGHVRMASEGPAGYGKQGSFEGFCSGGGLAQLGRTFALEALERGDRPAYCPDPASLGSVTARSLAEAAQAGDPTAQAVWRRCGDYLGRGLALLVDVLNPQAIVIGSIYARSGELLRGAMEAALRREALPHSRRGLRILPAALGERLGDMAALAVAANGLTI